MYKSMTERKAWLYHKTLVRLQGIKEFIKNITVSQGFIVVKTLSSELRFIAPFTENDINDLKKELGIEA